MMHLNLVGHQGQKSERRVTRARRVNVELPGLEE